MDGRANVRRFKALYIGILVIKLSSILRGYEGCLRGWHGTWLVSATAVGKHEYRWVILGFGYDWENS